MIAIPYQLAVVDVDQDPGLVQLYDELVPVLFGRNPAKLEQNGVGQQLCHYFLDADKVKAWCDE